MVFCILVSQGGADGKRSGRRGPAHFQVAMAGPCPFATTLQNKM
jgi:hypothetical protein